MADAPTSDDVQKGQSVAQAGAAAAAGAPPGEEQQQAATAMRAEADRQNLKMSDEDIDRIASVLSPKLLDGFEERGAFDPPPEAVQAPPNIAPAAPGDNAAAAPAPARRLGARAGADQTDVRAPLHGYQLADGGARRPRRGRRPARPRRPALGAGARGVENLS